MIGESGVKRFQIQKSKARKDPAVKKAMPKVIKGELRNKRRLHRRLK